MLLVAVEIKIKVNTFFLSYWKEAGIVHDSNSGEN